MTKDNQSDNNKPKDNLVESAAPEVTSAPGKKPQPPVKKPSKTSDAPPVGQGERRKKLNSLAITVVLMSLLAGFGGGTLATQIANKSPLTVLDRSSGTDGNTIISTEERNIEEVVNKVRPSVVSIVTEVDAFPFGGTQEGAGTGIIISEDGYVLTNKHVIDGASTMIIVDSEGERHDNVEVVGRDPLNDIAFLQIQGVSDLKPAELGNSSTIRIGQQVVAIGNSLGQYRNTVTSGIISGTNRPVTAQSGRTIETLTDLIQTDAAINPGNSGGPMVNMQGQVIGVNTAVAAQAQGIGFAIPINATKGMVRTVLRDGEVRRALLGVRYISLTPGVAAEYNLPVDQGAYIYNDGRGRAVVSGGPADNAGIREGDIITRIGDVEVGNMGSVSSLIAEYIPGDTVEIEYIRGGNRQTTRVTLEAYRD